MNSRISSGLEILGLAVPARTPKQPYDKLLMSTRATAKCKFNASLRLRRGSKYSFATTTILSLGLILIPLLQNSNIALALSPQVLNMMQIFLAVAVLVYSIVMARAGLDVRAEKLNECGDDLKDLARELDKSIAERPENFSDLLDNFNKRYADITRNTEGHSRIDYMAARLDMPNDYHVRGLRWLAYQGFVYWDSLRSLALPMLMFGIQACFILDMLGITHALPAVFHPPQ